MSYVQYDDLVRHIVDHIKDQKWIAHHAENTHLAFVGAMSHQRKFREQGRQLLEPVDHGGGSGSIVFRNVSEDIIKLGQRSLGPAQSRTSAPASAIAIKNRSDGLIACKPAGAQVRKTAPYRVALVVAQSICAEVPFFDLCNGANKLILGLLRPSRDTIQQDFESPTRHRYRLADIGSARTRIRHE